VRLEVERGSAAEVVGMKQIEGDGALNHVVLRGRVSGPPRQRDLPSGSALVAFRLVLARERTAMTSSSRQVSDWVEVSAWGTRVRKQAAGWREGDHVEVRGSLRRRFFTTTGPARSSLEVEMLGGRVVRRAGAPESSGAVSG
jgi:single-strand DNA-binding protein